MNYNAFISYRHSDLDMFVAKQVHKRLEPTRPPACRRGHCDSPASQGRGLGEKRGGIRGGQPRFLRPPVQPRL